MYVASAGLELRKNRCIIHEAMDVTVSMSEV